MPGKSQFGWMLVRVHPGCPLLLHPCRISRRGAELQAVCPSVGYVWTNVPAIWPESNSAYYADPDNAPASRFAAVRRRFGGVLCSRGVFMRVRIITGSIATDSQYVGGGTANQTPCFHRTRKA